MRKRTAFLRNQCDSMRAENQQLKKGIAKCRLEAEEYPLLRELLASSLDAQRREAEAIASELTSERLKIKQFNGAPANNAAAKSAVLDECEARLNARVDEMDTATIALEQTKKQFGRAESRGAPLLVKYKELKASLLALQLCRGRAPQRADLFLTLTDLEATLQGAARERRSARSRIESSLKLLTEF